MAEEFVKIGNLAENGALHRAGAGSVQGLLAVGGDDLARPAIGRRSRSRELTHRTDGNKLSMSGQT
jgi:hypothetical protein